MSKDITAKDITEIVEFYFNNGLNEIISEDSQNHFLSKDLPKKLAQKQIEVKKNITQGAALHNFIKPVFSTSDALGKLSNLAKQNQNINQDMAKINNAKLSEKNIDQSEKYVSLNEIVTKAKKLAKAAQNLVELRAAVENFDGCNLKKMATNTVFCDGSSASKVMVIGEAPGNHEDLQGIPFCGDSGKVLDGMFRGINMTRENFYITNVIFWRPPGNRRPTDEELAICRPFVERHIELVNPEVLVLVGATSMTALLGITEPISNIRGKFMDFSPKFLPRTIKTFTVFHPSYLMRQSSKKKLAWLDMLNLENFLQNL